MSRFPLNPPDQVAPSPPAAEPTREWLRDHPEDPVRQLARTRRYFRLTHQQTTLHYARGLDTHPDDFA